MICRDVVPIPSSTRRDRMSEIDAIVVISSVRWNFSWQRHHALARAAARSGKEVVFVEPHPRGIAHILSWLRRNWAHPSAPQAQNVPAGVSVVAWSPWDFFSGVRSRRVSRAMTDHQRSRTRVLLYLPSISSMRLARQMSSHSVIYDRVLDWANIPKSWFPPRRWRGIEAQIEESHYVLTDSERVRDRLAADNVDALLVEPCVDEEFADHVWGEPPVDGTIGYFGTILEDVIDVDRMIAVARNWPVEVIGDVDAVSREKLIAAGVRVLPPVPVSKLPEVVDHWSGIILFYRKDTGRDSLVPAKLWNCIATGRPVLISGLEVPDTALKHVRLFNDDPISRQLTLGQSHDAAPMSWDVAWREICKFSGIEVGNGNT